jgi:hypothetical protein
MAARLLAAAQARAVRQPMLQPVHMRGRGRPAGSMQLLRMPFRQQIVSRNNVHAPAAACLAVAEGANSSTDKQCTCS